MSALPRVLTRAVLLLAAVLVPALLPAGLPGRPDLVLLVVAAAALLHGPITGALTGLAGGWLLDLVPPGSEVLGATALVYAAAGWALGWSRRYAGWSSWWWLVATGSVAVAVLAVRAVVAAAGTGVVSPTRLGWSLALTLLCAALLLPALVALERLWVVRGWV